MKNKFYLFVLCTFFSLLFTKDARGTELRLGARDKNGKEISISSAELLLVAWGEIKRLPLEIQNGKLVLPLDEEYLRSKWPSRFNDMEKVYLYLKSDGYVAKRSEPFLWMRKQIPSLYIKKITSIELSFSNEQPIVLNKGDSVKAETIFRKPEKRYLKLVDEQGSGVPEITVSSFMYWSSSNHCGQLVGADFLGKAKSDALGLVSVPDGDFEYVFTFKYDYHKSHYILKKPTNSFFPRRFVTHFTAPEMTVVLHQIKRMPLQMRVTQNGEPIKNKTLLGRVAYCPCGACSGPVATTDEQGKIKSNYFPEELDQIFFTDEAGKVIWKTDPRNWTKTGIIHIELEPRVNLEK